MRQVTTQQQAMIERMEFTLDVNFSGSTFEEACQFINKHMDAYESHGKETMRRMGNQR